MSYLRFVLILGVVLGLATVSVAQEKTVEKRPLPKATDEVPPKPEPPKADLPPKADVPAKAGLGKSDVSTSPTPKRASTGEKVLRVHLMEGGVISGKLSVNSIMVETDFGKLEVPVSKIVSFMPG